LNGVFELHSKNHSFSDTRFYEFIFYEELTLEIYPEILDKPCVEVKTKFTYNLSILWSATNSYFPRKEKIVKIIMLPN